MCFHDHARDRTKTQRDTLKLTLPIPPSVHCFTCFSFEGLVPAQASTFPLVHARQSFHVLHLSQGRSSFSNILQDFLSGICPRHIYTSSANFQLLQLIVSNIGHNTHIYLLLMNPFALYQIFMNSDKV